MKINIINEQIKKGQERGKDYKKKEGNIWIEGWSVGVRALVSAYYYLKCLWGRLGSITYHTMTMSLCGA